MKLSQIAAAALAAAVLVPTTTACGSDAEDTKCKDFVKQSKEDQRKTVKDWALAESTSDKDKDEIKNAKDEELDALAGLVKGVCEKSGNQDKKLKDLDANDAGKTS